MKKWKEIKRKTKTIIFSALGATCLLATAGATTAYAVVSSDTSKTRLKDNEKPNKVPIGNKGFGVYKDGILNALKSSSSLPTDYKDLYYNKYENIDKMKFKDILSDNISVRIKAQHRIEIFIDLILTFIAQGSSILGKSQIYLWNERHNVGQSVDPIRTDNLIAPILLYHDFDSERIFEKSSNFSIFEKEKMINNSTKEGNINLFDYSKLSVFGKSQDFIKLLFNISTNLILKLYEIMNNKISEYISPFYTSFKDNNSSNKPTESKPNNNKKKWEDIQKKGEVYREYREYIKNNPIAANKLKIPGYSSSGNFSIYLTYYKNQDPSFRIMNNELNLGIKNNQASFLNFNTTNTLLNRTKLASFGYQVLSNTGYDLLLTLLHELLLGKSAIQKSEIEPTLDSILLFLLKAILATVFPPPLSVLLFGNILDNIKAAIIGGIMFLFRLYSVINYTATAIDYYVRYYTNIHNNTTYLMGMNMAFFIKENGISEIDSIISDFYGPKWMDFDLVSECSDGKEDGKKISSKDADALNFIYANLITSVKALFVKLFEGIDVGADRPGIMEFLILGFSKLNNILVNKLRMLAQIFFTGIYLLYMAVVVGISQKVPYFHIFVFVLTPLIFSTIRMFFKIGNAIDFFKAKDSDLLDISHITDIFKKNGDFTPEFYQVVLFCSYFSFAIEQLTDLIDKAGTIASKYNIVIYGMELGQILEILSWSLEKFGNFVTKAEKWIIRVVDLSEK